MYRMVEYADHRGCRHHFILKYFGDEEADERCNVCDNCLSHVSTSMRVPNEEETVIIQKALSCIARVNGRFGRGRIAQALVGSRSKEVIDVGLDRLSTYGLLADLGTDYVWSLLDSLIRARCIEVSGGQYPTLSLTELGGEGMRKQKTIPIALPQFGAAKRSAGGQTKSKAKRSRTGAVASEPAEESYDAA